MSANKSRIGRLFEKFFANKYRLKQVQNSGAGAFFKMDVEGNLILYSLKATAADSFRVTKKDLDEVIDSTIGPGGTGAIPALVFTYGLTDEEMKPTDPVLVTMQFDDLVALLSENAKAFKATPDDVKLVESEVPSLFKS